MTRRQLLNYLRSNEIDVQNANALVILADLVFRAYSESGSVHGVDYSPVNCYFTSNNKNFYQLISKKLIRGASHRVYDDFLLNKKSLDGYMERHERLGRDIERLGWRFLKNTDISNPELSAIYEALAGAMHEWWKYGVIGEDKGEVIADRVVPNFQKRHKLSAGEARDVVSILAHPAEQSVLNLGRKEFIGICLRAAALNKPKVSQGGKVSSGLLKDMQLQKLINEYLKHNYWSKTDFCEAFVITSQGVLAEVLQELESKTLGQLREELKQLEGSAAQIRREKRSVLKRIKLTAEDKAEIEFCQKTAHWIDRRKRGMMMQFYFFILLLKEIARRYGFSKDEIGLLSVGEVSALLRSGRKGLKIKKKLDAFVIYEKGREAQFIYGAPGQALLALAKGVKNTDQLKGMVASKAGLTSIQGIVKVIGNPDSEDFRAGEILVTSMTRIEYVPLMRRAKAIITNEGGVACHAAIVSRELGIPCIIGTKHATEILKSGDTVELDLESGRINKL